MRVDNTRSRWPNGNEGAVEGGIDDWGEVVTRYPYGNVGMDHLLSKEKRCGICLVLSVLREILEENIENWIIKKNFFTEKDR